MAIAFVLPNTAAAPTHAEASPARAERDARSAPIPVSVQLKWLHQFQFAGYYAAIEKGYYRDAGFEVTLLEGNPERSAAEVVLSGEATFGVSNSSLILDRARGGDVAVVAPIFQHSPFVMIARRAPGLENVHDLKGRRIMVEADAAEPLAYLRRAGVTDDNIDVVPHSGDPLVLAHPGISAATAYTTTEPYYHIKAEVPFQTFNPRELGIDFYGDTLFATGRLTREHPDLVRAFRDATLAGWTYALAHTDEIIDIIIERYDSDKDRRALEFEAEEIKRLMIADVVDLGYVSANRWQHIADVFESVGMLEPGFQMDGFLFDADRGSDLSWLVLPALFGASAILLLGWTTHRFHRMNKALRHEVAYRCELEAELLRLATTDELTGLPNRRRFFDCGALALMEAREDGRPLSLILLDIDRFKHINDTWGHNAGDDALRRVAAALREALRADDCVGRLGGEEFAAILPDMDEQGAIANAERIRELFETLRIVRADGQAIQITASIGAVTVRPGDCTFDDLLARADKAMYEAKNAGRNRVKSGLAA